MDKYTTSRKADEIISPIKARINDQSKFINVSLDVFVDKLN